MSANETIVPVLLLEHLGVRIDRLARRVHAGERELLLTGTEYRLLEHLVSRPGQAFTRKELVDSVIAGGAVVLERTIDKHIQALRAKLGDMELIETVRGIGYRFQANAHRVSRQPR